jgi:hypothetical protein
MSQGSGAGAASMGDTGSQKASQMSPSQEMYLRVLGIFSNETSEVDCEYLVLSGSQAYDHYSIELLAYVPSIICLMCCDDLGAQD